MNPGISEHQLDQLVNTVYEGVTDDEAMSAALSGLGERTGYMAFCVVQLNLAAGSFHTDLVSTEDKSHPLYMVLDDRVNGINPYYQPELVTSIVGATTFANETMPRSLVRKTEFYADYLKPSGINDIAGFFSVMDGGVVNSISFPREARGSYSDRDKALYQQLGPHVMRAFKLRHKLGVAQRQQHFLREVLDQQSQGMVFFNCRGEITWMNRSATETVARRDGLSWVGSHLRVGHGEINEQFQNVLHRQINSSGLHKSLIGQSLYCIPQEAGYVPYGISLAPVKLDEEFCYNGAPVVVGFLADPTREHNVTVEQMVSQYGLTRAEGNVAVQVASGLSLEQIAAANGQQVATTRNLLKRAFSKTGASRQPELAKLVWSSSLPVNLDQP